MEHAARAFLIICIVAAAALVVFLVGVPLYVPAGALAALDRRRLLPGTARCLSSCRDGPVRRDRPSRPYRPGMAGAVRVRPHHVTEKTRKRGILSSGPAAAFIHARTRRPGGRRRGSTVAGCERAAPREIVESKTVRGTKKGSHSLWLTVFSFTAPHVGVRVGRGLARLQAKSTLGSLRNVIYCVIGRRVRHPSI
jgi:hypothetical protein